MRVRLSNLAHSMMMVTSSNSFGGAVITIIGDVRGRSVIVLGVVMLMFMVGTIQMQERSKSISKEEAVSLAKEEGRMAGYDVDAYTISVNEEMVNWIVDFVKGSAPVRGGEQHFTIWIEKQTGESTLFRGR